MEYSSPSHEHFGAKDGNVVERSPDRLVYSYHETNSTCGLADGIEDLMAVKMSSNNLERFFDRWRVVLFGILGRPDEKTLEAFFVRQLRLCDQAELKIEIAHYDSV